MNNILTNSWNDILKDEFDKDYYKNLRSQLINEYNEHTIYPDKHDIFNALHYTDFKDVKVVKGNVQVELKLKENYNKALKFMYYVEV